MNTKPPVSTWPLIVGVGFLAISLIFFMVLVLIAVLLRMEVPFDSRFLVVIILSLTTATGSAFLGGYAKASGKISLPFLKDPLAFGITGGVAVFFLVLLFGHLLYSGRNDTSAAAIVSFHNFKEDYREKYEDLHNDLDMATILSDVDGVKEMNYEEYGKFLISKVNNTEGAHVAIDAVANFYEDILKCERDRGVGCSESDINRTFGGHIHDFWFTYRPYILFMRKNGYPTLASLVEQRALQLK